MKKIIIVLLFIPCIGMAQQKEEKIQVKDSLVAIKMLFNNLERVTRELDQANEFIKTVPDRYKKNKQYKKLKK